MQRVFKRIYQGASLLFCRFYRQCLPFFVIAVALLTGSISQAYFRCQEVHTKAFEFRQRASLQQFVDLYVTPEATDQSNAGRSIFGFSLVSDLRDATRIYEFNATENRAPEQLHPSPNRQVISRSSFTQLSLPQKELEVQTSPNDSTSRYQMTDVGFSLLAKDDPILQEAFDRARSGKDPNQPFQIEYHPDYLRAKSFLRMLHQWVSLLVTDVYANRKGYLSPSDLYSLREGDLSPESLDNYFVLQKLSSQSLMQQSYNDFLKETLAVIRLVRANRLSLLMPQKEDRRMNSYQLPVVKRFIGSDIGERLKNALFDVGDRGQKSFGEISRFVRTTDFPEPLMDSLIKNVFETAIQPNGKVDIVLISVDKVTRRLFSKYRFQDLMPLTDPNKETAEFLMYLDTASPEFHETLAELRKKAAAVHESEFQNSTPVVLKDRYPAPPGWNKGSRWEAFEASVARLKELRASDRRHRYNQKFSGLMLSLVGYILPGQKVLIVSEHKDSIYESLWTAIDPSDVSIVGINEIDNIQNRHFDSIIVSGSEYGQIEPGRFLKSLTKLGPYSKDGTAFDITAPSNFNLRDDTSLDSIKNAIQTATGKNRKSISIHTDGAALGFFSSDP